MSYQRLWELISKKTCQSLMTGGINLLWEINWIDTVFMMNFVCYALICRENYIYLIEYISGAVVIES